MKTWGWETTLGWRDNIGKVIYYVNGSLTDNHNKLISYGGKNIITAGTNIIEGFPLDSYFGLVYDGRIQTDEQIATYGLLSPGSNITRMPTANQVMKGINMFKDLNGDGKLTNAGSTTYTLGLKDANGNPIPDGDVKYLGDSRPHLSFSVNMGAEWKGFDLSVIFQGVGKRLIYRRSDWSIPLGTYWQGHANWWVGKTWTPTIQMRSYQF